MNGSEQQSNKSQALMSKSSCGVFCFPSLQSGLRVAQFGATLNAGWCLKNVAAAADVRRSALMDR